jgi:PTH2 family peptidyl-tRNA hydrolase
MDVKQVLIIRKDLNMRKGKMVSQGAHASMKVLLDSMSKTEDMYSLKLSAAWGEWLNGSFTKITLGFDSEEELLGIHEKAKNSGLPVSLIIDNGLTEFNGVKTITAIAIGPDFGSAIDEVTGHLKLL